MREVYAREAPPLGTLRNRPIAPVETVFVWDPGFHPFAPNPKYGDDANAHPCMTCAPWGIGAHVHYPRLEYVAPDTIYEVGFYDYDAAHADSYWYDEAKAQERADALNREEFERQRPGLEQARDRWLEIAGTLTDAEVAYLDAAMIAWSAKERGVRRAAADVRDRLAPPDYAPGDPREAAEAVAEQTTFEGWSKGRAIWQVTGGRIEDARIGATEGREG